MLMALLVVAGCGSNESTPTLAPTPAPPPAPSPAPAPPPAWTPVESLKDIEFDPNTPEAILLSGKRTFQSSCSACHDLPTTQQIKEFPSDEAMTEVAIPMTGQSELPLEYAEKVIRYLLAVRNNTAP